MPKRSRNSSDNYYLILLLFRLSAEHPVIGILILVILGFLILIEGIGSFYHSHQETIVAVVSIMAVLWLGFIVWFFVSKLWKGYKDADDKKQYIKETLCFGLVIAAFAIVIVVYMFYRRYVLSIAAVLPVIISLMKNGITIKSLVGYGVGLALIFAYLQYVPYSISQTSSFRVGLEFVFMFFWWIGCISATDHDAKEKEQSIQANTPLLPEGEFRDENEKCPNCGVEVKKGGEFCGQCGTKLK